MRNAVLLVCSVMLLLAPSAGADLLKLQRGDQLQGTLQQVTFMVKNIQSIYPREDIVGVTVGSDGGDTLEVEDEAKKQGKLVSVVFETLAGLSAVPREKIEAITLDAATTVDVLKAKQRAEDDSKEEEKEQLTDEQKQALTKNRELYKTYSDKAEKLKKDDYQSIRTRYMDQVRGIVSQVVSLERTIQNKIRRREEASGRTYTDSSGNRQMSDRERLERTDGLARDQRDLQRAYGNANRLKSTIRAEQRKVSDRAKERTARLETAYSINRKDALGGQVPTDDDMIARYDKAMKVN